ncbi:MAG: hypothetical protein IKI11_11435 [Neisseriaceae bacterium]|nr:hypothetical protein [Neisseriaceae bacterium]
MKNELEKQLTNKELLAILKKIKKQSNYISMCSLVVMIVSLVVYLLNMGNVKNNMSVALFLLASTTMLPCLLSAYALYVRMYLTSIVGGQCENITKKKLIDISELYIKVSSILSLLFMVLFVIIRNRW